MIFNLQSFSQVFALEMLYMTLVTFYKRSTHMGALFDFCQSFYQQTIIFDFTVLYILLSNAIESRAIVLYQQRIDTQPEV